MTTYNLFQFPIGFSLHLLRVASVYTLLSFNSLSDSHTNFDYSEANFTWNFQFPIGFSRISYWIECYLWDNFQFPIGFSLSQTYANSLLIICLSIPYRILTLRTASNNPDNIRTFNSLSDSHHKIDDKTLVIPYVHLSIPYRILTIDMGAIENLNNDTFQFPIGFSLTLLDANTYANILDFQFPIGFSRSCTGG